MSNLNRTLGPATARVSALAHRGAGLGRGAERFFWILASGPRKRVCEHRGRAPTGARARAVAVPRLGFRMRRQKTGSWGEISGDEESGAPHPWDAADGGRGMEGRDTSPTRLLRGRRKSHNYAIGSGPRQSPERSSTGGKTSGTTPGDDEKTTTVNEAALNLANCVMGAGALAPVLLQVLRRRARLPRAAPQRRVDLGELRDDAAHRERGIAAVSTG